MSISSENILQIVSLLGAMLLLVAYACHQNGAMDSRKPMYNILNAIGSACLGYVAFFPFKIGFVILEGAWVAISIWALLRKDDKEHKA